jgi:5-methylcytosine-specific restriction endonuclease McrA
MFLLLNPRTSFDDHIAYLYGRIQSKGLGRPARRAALMAQLYPDGFCSYCGRRMMHATRDHVVPVASGGRNSAAYNLVPACADCNSAKNDLSLLQFLLQRAQQRDALEREYLYEQDRLNRFWMEAA